MTMEFNVGDRIELVRMGQDPCPIEPGAKGTVDFINALEDFTQFGIEWDNGRRLMVCTPEDEIRKIER